MNDKANIISIVLGTLGVLFMMAMAFKILPMNVAIFAGVACFIIAGAIKRVASQRD